MQHIKLHKICTEKTKKIEHNEEKTSKILHNLTRRITKELDK